MRRLKGMSIRLELDTLPQPEIRHWEPTVGRLWLRLRGCTAALIWTFLGSRISMMSSLWSLAERSELNPGWGKKSLARSSFSEPSHCHR